MTEQRHPTTGSLYPPHVLREYSLLADGERGALVGPRGEVVWLCAPRWDSPSVFGSLIGAAGAYAVTPVDRFVWGGYYEPASLIWRSRWVTGAGIVECREALARPADLHRTVLLRRIQPRYAADLDVVLFPQTDFGNRGPRQVQRDDGIWTARVGDLYLRWSGGEGCEPVREGGSAGWRGRVHVGGGEHHDLVLEISDRPLPDELPRPDALWSATAAAWERDVPSFEDSLAPADTRQNYAVLKGLTSSGGGMVAAATTSLPERADKGRSYDYRYVWIRDQCFTGQAVAADGPHPLLDDAVTFVAQRLHAEGAQMAPAYTVSGEPLPDQRSLDLPGYPGGTDIVGNHVNGQFQLDAFGEALLLFASAARLDHLDTEGWQAAEIAATAIAQRWTEPDAGIWELDTRPWTHSRLTAAAGLRAIAAAGTPTSSKAGEWLALADRIVADTAAAATAPGGHWHRSPDDPGLDAALLLPPLRGALRADDPRTVATLEAYRRELTRDGYAYRFRQDDRPLGEAEGAFQLCGFLMAMALQQQGDAVGAARWFERTRAACGPPQLYSEEFDARQNQMRGNLPQAFVHAFMIESSVRLARPLP